MSKRWSLSELIQLEQARGRNREMWREELYTPTARLEEKNTPYRWTLAATAPQIGPPQWVAKSPEVVSRPSPFVSTDGLEWVAVRLQNVSVFALVVMSPVTENVK
jgi:hypothetical protein